MAHGLIEDQSVGKDAEDGEAGEDRGRMLAISFARLAN